MISHPSNAAPILAVLAIVLVTLGAYVGGYYGLGHCREHRHFEFGLPTSGDVWAVERTYKSQWIHNLYLPAAWIEGRFRGIDVHLNWRGSNRILNIG